MRSIFFGPTPSLPAARYNLPLITALPGSSRLVVSGAPSGFRGDQLPTGFGVRIVIFPPVVTEPCSPTYNRPSGPSASGKRVHQAGDHPLRRHHALPVGRQLDAHDVVADRVVGDQKVALELSIKGIGLVSHDAVGRRVHAEGQDRRYIVGQRRHALPAAVLEDALVAVRIRMAIVLTRQNQVHQIGLNPRIIGCQVAHARAGRRRVGRIGAVHPEAVVRPVHLAVRMEREVVHIAEAGRIGLHVAGSRNIEATERGGAVPSNPGAFTSATSSAADSGCSGRSPNSSFATLGAPVPVLPPWAM